MNVLLEKWARAADAYEAYLKLDERSAGIFYKLALVRVREGNPDRAISSLRQALTLNGRFAEALYLLGMCQAQRGNLPEAVTALEEAVQLAPALLPARAVDLNSAVWVP